MQGDGGGTPLSQPATSKKKKRGARAVGPDKNGRGLCKLSMRVRDKVESKGRTTYNEVADELVAEFSDPNINIEFPDPDNPFAQQFDEKNIRRRVYDALNVLEALGIICKDKKEIQWTGLPRTTMNDIEELKTEGIRLKAQIGKKNAYLQELEDRYVCLQNLVRRNKQLYGSGDAPSSRLDLQFVLAQTNPQATVDLEVTEDRQLVLIDFSSTPFQLLDDSFVIKAMGLCCKEETDFTQALVENGGECSSIPQPPGPIDLRVSNLPPIPGILKGHVKHQH